MSCIIPSFNLNNEVTIKLPSGKLTNFNDFGYFYIWAIHHSIKNKVIMAAVGRPILPVFNGIKDGSELYWKSLKMDEAIEYGDLRGEPEYRQRMVLALEREYKTNFDKDQIIFTVGGRSGLRAIFYMIRTLFQNKKIVNTLPFYPDHIGSQEKLLAINESILVNTLKHGRITAELLEDALKGIEPQDVGAFVFCEPNNPMGYTISECEWSKIVIILKKFPDAVIVLDEAYAEMVFDKPHVSLISIAPELKNRIVLLRSATKGFSAAGERMAILVAFENKYLEVILEYNFTNLIHAPKSGQFAYTYAMERLTDDIKLNLANYYKVHVRNIESILRETNFNFKTIENYCVDSTFYIIADFSELIGLPIGPELKDIYQEEKNIIEHDVDIVFYLLFKYNLAFMPLSLFGVGKECGLVRITCALMDGEQEMIKDNLHKLRILLNAKILDSLIA